MKIDRDVLIKIGIWLIALRILDAAMGIEFVVLVVLSVWFARLGEE